MISLLGFLFLLPFLLCRLLHFQLVHQQCQLAHLILDLTDQVSLVIHHLRIISRPQPPCELLLQDLVLSS